jgi:hypothetical protein
MRTALGEHSGAIDELRHSELAAPIVEVASSHTPVFCERVHGS